jgi:hypothetical protein
MFLGIPATNLQSSKAITIVTMKVSPSLVALVTGLFNSPVLIEAFHGMGQPTKTTTLATGGFSVARGNMRRTRLFAMKKKEEKKIETRQVTVTDPLKTAHFVCHTLEKSQQHFRISVCGIVCSRKVQ